MTAPAWTKEQMQHLRALWLATTTDGKPQWSTTEIAQQLRISKNAIVGKAHRMNLPPRPSPIKPREPALPPKRAEVPRLPKAAPAVAETADTVSWRRAWGVQTCQWPIGDVRDPGFRFCGAPAVRGSYCARCAERAFVGRVEA